MKQPQLTKVLPALFYFFLVSAQAETTCKEVSLKSLSIDQTSKETLCFVQHENYFISNNCKSSDCLLIKKIKAPGPALNGNNRPGIELCNHLTGTVEKIQILTSNKTMSRCVFKDGGSISLNLLESWNGAFFAGPGSSLEF